MVHSDSHLQGLFLILFSITPWWPGRKVHLLPDGRTDCLSDQVLSVSSVCGVCERHLLLLHLLPLVPHPLSHAHFLSLILSLEINYHFIRSSYLYRQLKRKVFQFDSETEAKRISLGKDEWVWGKKGMMENHGEMRGEKMKRSGDKCVTVRENVKHKRPTHICLISVYINLKVKRGKRSEV